MSEIVPVVSESLEAQVRNLLPSQRGFGEDLQASNVIVPIIDLTTTAEGTATGELLQTALAFGSVTAFEAINSSVTIANTPGFWRIFGQYSASDSANNPGASINLSDGLTTKKLIGFSRRANGGSQAQLFDFVVFLRAGDDVSCTTNDITLALIGSAQQIADVNGNLINPSGFTPQ